LVRFRWCTGTRSRNSHQISCRYCECAQVRPGAHDRPRQTHLRRWRHRWRPGSTALPNPGHRARPQARLWPPAATGPHAGSWRAHEDERAGGRKASSGASGGGGEPAGSDHRLLAIGADLGGACEGSCVPCDGQYASRQQVGRTFQVSGRDFFQSAALRPDG